MIGRNVIRLHLKRFRTLFKALDRAAAMHIMRQRPQLLTE